MHVPELIDRALLRARRGRFAKSLAAHDFLLRRAAEDIVARLETVLRAFPLALDLGAQHGVLARMLGASGRVGTVICAEAVPSLLALCPPPRLACDEEALPFAAHSLDLVVSALSLHLVNDLPGTLVQIRRVLRPDGLFLAAVLGGHTLSELRDALTAAEAELEGGARPHIVPFADVRDYGALLQRAGFALPVTDVDTVRVSYADPISLMKEVRALGGGNVLKERSRSPWRRSTLLRAAEIYAERYAEPNGRVTATFEIVHLCGWAPHASQPKPLAPGSARMRLADALGTKEYATGIKGRPAKPPR